MGIPKRKLAIRTSCTGLRDLFSRASFVVFGIVILVALAHDGLSQSSRKRARNRTTPSAAQLKAQEDADRQLIESLTSKPVWSYVARSNSSTYWIKIDSLVTTTKYRAVGPIYGARPTPPPHEIVSGWFLTVLEAPFTKHRSSEQDPRYAYALIHYQFNCKERGMVEKQGSTEYDRNGNPLPQRGYKVFYEAPGPFSPVVPGSIGEALLIDACRRIGQ